jgi:DNA-binding PadR family transcriptional regulator
LTAKSPKESDVHGFPFLSRPQGAPRGLLLYYVLHRISKGPTHGYEIAHDIEEKTDGAWRPAPGSMYPMLRKLESQGLIKAKTSTAKRSSETEQRVYEITPNGLTWLNEGKQMFTNASNKLSSIRKIFLELLDPQDAARFFAEGSRMQLEGSRDVVESKFSSLPPSEVESLLKEYELNLERQLNWTRKKIAEIGKSTAPTPTARSRRTGA